MRKLITSSAVLALTAGAAVAGGLDRSNQSIGFLYEDPGVTAFSFGIVAPSITGTDNNTSTTYDVGDSYNQMSASQVIELSPQLSLGLQFDQPFGAATTYKGDPSADTLAGTAADISTNSLNAIAKYQMNENFSVFGGLRIQSARGNVSLNGQGYALSVSADQAIKNTSGTGDLEAGTLSTFVRAFAACGNNPATCPSVAAGQALSTAQTAAVTEIATGGGNPTTLNTAAVAAGTAFLGYTGYNVDIDDSWGLGYTVGAAYEVPSIALRASISYQSSVKHKGDTVEMLSGVATNSTTTFETPSSINIDFQTGIAEGTLLTAGIRMAEWGDFDVTPQKLGNDLADIDDSKRYTLGIARVINDNLALSATLTHEPEGDDDNVSPLAPTNGLTGLSLGARYKTGAATISGGIGYTVVGDANAALGDNGVATFTDNHVVGAGIQVKFEF